MHTYTQVPNLECSCIGITGSGSTIVSGWSDGKLRAFYPESGKLKFVIADAHADGVTALALAHDDDSRPPWRIISGGGDGRVRVWRVTPSHQVNAYYPTVIFETVFWHAVTGTLGVLVC
jgi:cilia- and flagella-associated protein 52